VHRIFHTSEALLRLLAILAAYRIFHTSGALLRLLAILILLKFLITF
jgi:hypothetical protein